MKLYTRALFAALILGFVASGRVATAADLEKTRPENVGLSSSRLAGEIGRAHV